MIRSTEFFKALRILVMCALTSKLNKDIEPNSSQVILRHYKGKMRSI